MPPAANEFQELVAQARAGCPTATRALVERYARPLRFVLGRLLSRSVRPLVDADDCLQSIWRDFFLEALRAQDFATPEGLLAFLAQMARHKAQELHRKHLDTQKRNRGREQSLGAADKAALVDPRPTPAQTVLDDDELDRRLAVLPAKERRLVLLLRSGASVAEVASELSMSERTVRRLLEAVRGRRAEPG